MRTAIISDLHLGTVGGSDLLRDPATRAVLLDELRGAERLVLLGDVVELRERPLGVALDYALPVLEEIGTALGAVDVILVPGNHDSRLAEPLLDRLSIEHTRLALDSTAEPAEGPLTAIAAALSPARLRIAYPGVWLREDVYATHGHYMNLHIRAPRAECVALAMTQGFIGQLPDEPTPDDYERIMRPLFGLAFGTAQTRLPKPTKSLVPSERAWEVLAGAHTGRGRLGSIKTYAARAGFPLAVAAVNRFFHADFESEISDDMIFRTSLEGGIELARRLGVDDGHVITGHTHRAGPRADEGTWRLPGGGELHNTGSWVFSTPLHRPGAPPNSYWPGTVTWVEDSGPPRRVELLRDRDHAEMVRLVAQIRGLTR